MAAYCSGCGAAVANSMYCPRCGVAQTSGTSPSNALLPPAMPDLHPPHAADPLATTIKASRVAARKKFLVNYKLALILLAVFVFFDLVLTLDETSQHWVNEPWPSIFALTSALFYVALIVTAFLRRPEVFIVMVGLISVAVAVRTWAVYELYTFPELTVWEHLWTIAGVALAATAFNRFFSSARG